MPTKKQMLELLHSWVKVAEYRIQFAKTDTLEIYWRGYQAAMLTVIGEMEK